MISGRNTKVLEESAKLLGCKYLQLDVSKPSEFDSFMKNAYNLLDGMNVLVNNAGISLHENSFFDVTPDTFDAQYDTNLKGPFFLTQSFIRQIREYGTTKASVLFVSSETGETMDFRLWFKKGLRLQTGFSWNQFLKLWQQQILFVQA